MPVPGLPLLGLKRIRGFVSILRYINPTIIIIIILNGWYVISLQPVCFVYSCIEYIYKFVKMFLQGPKLESLKLLIS